MATGAPTRQPTAVSEFLKRIVVGRALASHKAEHQLLPKSLALPVFASDQLSSVSYASEEMMLVLALVGASGLALLTPLSIGVAVLLVIVIVSYRQTVREYPRGGGSYIVARENLGTLPGLTAAAAIQTSYVLTVSVSMTAGAIAVTSAVPALADQKVVLAISFIVLVTVANLRGAKEAGKLFAIPTYGFVVAVLGTIAWGSFRCVTEGCPQAETADVPLEGTASLSVFLVLRAFSSGATALTGVEAIADGVQAFRRPQSRNAAVTLAVMGAMSIPMFLGISGMASALDIRVTHEIAASKSVLAQIGETVYGQGPLFIVLQIFTALILILAANTAYQDFPRLSSILARDRFMPSQFRNRGDRLVYSNGIAVLSVLAAALVWAFDADLSRLIQLYVVGVFTALTLSQAGMVRRWARKRSPGWFRKSALNAVGATTTGLVFVIVILTRFSLGAWMVVVAVPFIVLAFTGVHRHYDRIRRILEGGTMTGSSFAANHVVLLVPGFNEATDEAIAYLRAIRPAEEPEVFWIGPPEGLDVARETWRARAPRLGELRLLDGADRHLVRAVRRLIRERPHAPQDFLTILIPEQVQGTAIGQLMRVRGRAEFLLKTSLLFQPGVVVTDIPFLPEEAGTTHLAGDRPLEPERSVVLIPVSAVHDPTVRAVLYGRSLNPTHVEALFMVMDPEDQQGMVEQWHARDLDVPLVMVEAPFRDITEPLLAEVRRHTSRGDTIVTVVLPELIPRHWWENLLHGQTSLFIKRLLLTEPRVVLTSVPFHLRQPEVADEDPVRT
ncbi:MAG TPA: APC family permease [Actinomycetota bacterium]|nr:APC family permease [Actinomycetota bacterium]